jgi:hypothetical protein
MWAVAQVREFAFSATESLRRMTSLPIKSESEVPMVNIAQPTSKNPSYEHWNQRMSNFKGLQIALEEHLVFAARMGRVEQIESQLLFPLTVRGAWGQSSLYLLQLARLQNSSTSNASPKQIGLLKREVERTHRTRFYIWEKLRIFLGDHYYLVMDAGADHFYRDKYLGEALFLFSQLTTEIQASNPNIAEAEAISNIAKMSTQFAKQPRFDDSQSIDGSEYRQLMTRQWEILFLLQNRAQEASNYGRMAYTESVRTSLFAIQNLFSAKTIILERIFNINTGKDNTGKDNTGRDANENSTAVLQAMPLFKQARHLIAADLASLAPELQYRLPNDTEYEMRTQIIRDIQDFGKEELLLERLHSINSPE